MHANTSSSQAASASIHTAELEPELPKLQEEAGKSTFDDPEAHFSEPESGDDYQTLFLQYTHNGLAIKALHAMS